MEGRKRGAWALGVLFVLVSLAGYCSLVRAEPKEMSDDELGEVTARGVGLDFSLTDDQGGVNFQFDLGSTLGNGSVDVSSSALPSTAVIEGSPNFTGAHFYVENMIFNFNLCVQCRADIINQIGLGAGVTITPAPVQ